MKRRASKEGISLKSSNQKILIVDDNIAIHDDFKRLLQPTNNRDSNLDSLEASLFGTVAVSNKEDTEYELESAYQGLEAVNLSAAS